MGEETKASPTTIIDCATGYNFKITDWSTIYWHTFYTPGGRVNARVDSPEPPCPEMDPPVMLCEKWNVKDGDQVYPILQRAQGKFQIGETNYNGKFIPVHGMLLPSQLQDENGIQPFWMASDFPYWQGNQVDNPDQMIKDFIDKYDTVVHNNYDADDRKEGTRIVLTPVYIYLDAAGPVLHAEIWSWLGKLTPDTE